MRLLAAAIATFFVLSLPLLAQAGEGCPHAKQSTAAASAQAPAGDAPKALACHKACPHAHAAAAAKASGGCPCAGAVSAARPPASDVAMSTEPATAPAQSVSATD